MMYKNLEFESQGLLRKVAFNPQTYALSHYAKKKGLLTDDEDFADFIN